MPTYELRPDSGVYPAVADDSDGTFFSMSAGQTLIFNYYETLALSTGERVVSTRLRLRGRYASGNAYANGFVSFPTYRGPDINALVTASFATYAGAPKATNATQADLNDMQVSVTALFNDVDLSEVYVDVYTALQPTAALSYPTGTPTLTDTNYLTATWSHTPGTDGGPQSRYEFKVYSSGQYAASGFDPNTSQATAESGVVLSPATTASSAALPDGTYRAYLRTAQTINGQPHWSDWTYAAFVVDVDAPVIDSIAVEPFSDSARVKITVTRDTGAPDWDYLDVERTSDGITWLPVRGATRTDPPGNSWIGYDYEAPMDTVVRYRARPLSSDSGTIAGGEWVESASTSWTSELIWVKALYSTGLTRSFDCLLTRPTVNYARQQGINMVLGSSAAVVVSDVLGLRSGVLELETTTDTAEIDLLRLLDEQVLLIQIPSDLHVRQMYVVTGQPSAAQPYVADPRIEWSIPFTEVLQPFDDGSEVLTSGLTWDDLATLGVSWDDLYAAQVTWGSYL